MNTKAWTEFYRGQRLLMWSCCGFNAGYGHVSGMAFLSDLIGRDDAFWQRQAKLHLRWLDEQGSRDPGDTHSHLTEELKLAIAETIVTVTRRCVDSGGQRIEWGGPKWALEVKP